MLDQRHRREAPGRTSEPLAFRSADRGQGEVRSQRRQDRRLLKRAAAPTPQVSGAEEPIGGEIP
jgi:hypothetical protein